MDFEKEKDMLEIVESWLSPQVTHYEKELGCGYCSCNVPDIVGIKLDAEKLLEFKRKKPMDRSYIRKMINENRVPLIYHMDLIAIELKLRNFVEAFFQAKMYAYFGFRSYIAMPKGVYANLPAIRIKVMRQDGIGFIAVDHKCTVILEAQKAIVFSLEEEIQIADRLICGYKKVFEHRMRR